MGALQVVRLGHPALRAQSTPVSQAELSTPEFQCFLDDLGETCVANNGVGIAAPQVAVNKRVIVVRVESDNPRYPGRQPFPLMIVVNPTVEERSAEHGEDWEGDLSANIRGLVPRARTCVVAGLDRNGNPVRFELTDNFHARVFQHEIDHLDGFFFIDRVARMDTICELAEWEKYWKDRDVKVLIAINRPAHEVFDFTLDPNNTPKWVDHIAQEEVSEKPTRLGTVYRNRAHGGAWNTYEITSYEPRSGYVMSKNDGAYHVRYTFTPLGEARCELEYHVWAERGDLDATCTRDSLQALLQKLKDTVEAHPQMPR